MRLVRLLGNTFTDALAATTATHVYGARGPR